MTDETREKKIDAVIHEYEACFQAYTAGNITESEYDATSQALLDKLFRVMKS